MINERTYSRSMSDVVSDLKGEVKEFAQTRIEMLKAEMREKLAGWKTAAPLIGAAVLFGLTAFFVLTACLVAIVAQAFTPSPWAYVLSTLIVFVAYAIIAGACAFLARTEIKKNKITPDRTMRVLKQDQAWIQNETTRRAA